MAKYSREEELRGLQATIEAINEAISSWNKKIQAGDLDQEEISFELNKAQVDKAACEAQIAELKLS